MKGRTSPRETYSPRSRIGARWSTPSSSVRRVAPPRRTTTLPTGPPSGSTKRSATSRGARGRASVTDACSPSGGATNGTNQIGELCAVLEALRAHPGAEPLVIVLNLEKDRAADYLALAAELRGAGVRAEAFLGGGNMGKQLKYADRRGADIAVIIGEDERQNGMATIKDLKLGAKLAAEIEDNRTWREEQPAQETVSRGDLVKAILGRIKAVQV